MNKKTGSAVKMTARGTARVRAEISALEARLEEVRKEKAEAAETGNVWHDNFGFEAAEQEERRLMYQVASLNRLLSQAEVVDCGQGGDSVGMGSRVEIRLPDSSIRVLQIAGVGESDPNAGIISCASPLAKAILGARPGECREFSVGDRIVRVRVLQVMES